MKTLLTIVCVLSAFNIYAYEKGHIHVPLELSFEESMQWHQILKRNQKSLSSFEPLVKESIDGGEKMNLWLKLVNEDRADGAKIRLTNPNTQRGIPIDKPSVYGPKSIKETYLKLESEMPKSLFDVFYGKKKISKNIPISESDFILWARKTSKLYQTAVRWTGMKRWLPQLAERKIRDVRGYYYLKNLENLDHDLENIIAHVDRLLIESALEGICINKSGLNAGCSAKVDRAVSSGKAVEFKNNYWKAAESNWSKFFNISNPRRDVVWSQSAPNTMQVVFQEIKDQRISHWLKENVEDEFQRSLLNWNMELTYVQKRIFSSTAYLEFKPNVTPHVSGGNQIVMDANTAIEEYGVRWTIRHEFGHILRIPDCYHEFYEPSINSMVNYQLDTTDLMCSRAGKMNDRIYNELKRNYLTR